MVTGQAGSNNSALFAIAVTPNSSRLKPVPPGTTAPIKF